jgi:serine kinase of HPr protein (carbohydrate metabolism regulator)
MHDSSFLNESQLPLKIRARYGDLVRTFDRRAPGDTDNDLMEWPVPHIRTLFPVRKFARRRKRKTVVAAVTATA